MSDYPSSVGITINSLNQLKGISEVSVDLQYVEEISTDALSLPAEYAVLPHLAIRRSGGGRKHEALISFEFVLSKDKHGWIALEFLSWWVRDMCRSGHEIQLRPQAMPPSVGDTHQLGKTLRFLLELFYVEPNDDPELIAEYVGACGEFLKESMDAYSKDIKKASPKRRFFG